MPYRLTPADKARNTRVRKLADELELCLLKLQREGSEPAAVVDLFASTKAKPDVRCDAFWLLDNDWRTNGHALLRGCRNHPQHGPELFALFR